MSTFIGIVKKKGSIKTVEYLNEDKADILTLGAELQDYFKDVTDVEAMVVTTIDTIDDGYVYPYEEEPVAFDEFADQSDFLDSVDIEEDLFYIYDDGWFVIGGDYEELTELEIALEEA